MGKGFDFDLVVIGAGIGGFVCAVTANGLGKKVAIVEKRRFGGNCTSFTCIPSKALVRAGHVASVMRRAESFGLRVPLAGGVQTEEVMSRVRRVVAEAYAKDLPETFEEIGIQVLFGQARFLDPHHLDVEGRSVSSDKFIIATGTRPLIPEIPGLDEVSFLTNESLYELDTLPRSILILGGGADGLEYACAFKNLGVEVTVLQRGRQLLPRQDREMVHLLERHMRESGIQLLLGARPVRFFREDQGVSVVLKHRDEKTVEISASALLVTIGRELEVEELGLDHAGVRWTPQGIVTDATLRTSAPNIYACGDVAGPYQLASTAEYQGILAATNAFLPVKKKVDYENMAFVLFTDPPLSYAGMTEEEARKRHGGDLRVYRFDYHGMRRAMVDGAEVGAAKFLCDRRGKLVGVHILGEGAPEVIHEAQVLRTLGIPLRRLQTMTHAYPTYAQALVGRASQLAFLDHLAGSPWVRLGLRVLPGMENRLGTARRRLAEKADTGEVSQKSEVLVRFVDSSGREVCWSAIQLGEKASVLRLPPRLTEVHSMAPPGSGASFPWLVVDFSQLEMMNGLGAVALVRLWVEASKRGQVLLAVGVGEHYRGVLGLTGLDRAMRICDGWDQVWGELGWRPKIPLFEKTPSAQPQDQDFWARPVETFPGLGLREEALDLNLKGRRVSAVMTGFGSLWQKTYELRVHGLHLGAEELMGIFRENFSRLQAPFNRFHTGPSGLKPGAVLAIHSKTPGGYISTGVMVLFADPCCFSLITPQGHPEAGWMSFRALVEKDTPVVQIVGFGRASDLFFEVAYRVLGSRMQVKTWTHVLAALAEHLGVQADIRIREERVDSRFQWGRATNLWMNAQIRTLLPWNTMRVRRLWLQKGPAQGDPR
ncbi:MAG: FAD-dependent oxidoreductase [Thermodesulfobacteriota bacterium]